MRLHVAAMGAALRAPPQARGIGGEARRDIAPAMARAPVILQVLPALGGGGVERGTVEIADGIVAAGWTSLVASAGGAREAALTGAGSRHLTMPLDRRTPWAIRANARRLAAAIRREGVDIVHARSRAPAWSAWLACRATGAHLVTTWHGVYHENLPLKRRYNAIMARGERVIAVSRYVAEHLIARTGVDPARVRVIHRGVDAAVFDPAAVDPGRIERLARAWDLLDGQAVVMLPGRLTRLKGQLVLIEALARLPRPDVRCLLVGDPQGREAYRAELERAAAAAGVPLTIAGHVEDVPAALLLADVVVQPSTVPESFGRAVIEAQAMGRPVIASDLGGPAETVEPGVTGWRVPPGDPAALAAAIAHALAMPAEERAALGARARAAVLASFTVARMQAATLAVYREVLGEGGGG